MESTNTRLPIFHKNEKSQRKTREKCRAIEETTISAMFGSDERFIPGYQCFYLSEISSNAWGNSVRFAPSVSRIQATASGAWKLLVYLFKDVVYCCRHVRHGVTPLFYNATTEREKQSKCGCVTAANCQVWTWPGLQNLHRTTGHKVFRFEFQSLFSTQFIKVLSVASLRFLPKLCAS